MQKKQCLFVLFLMTVVTSFVCARSGGGGGMLFGYQTSTYPFLNKYPVTNNSLELVYYGGYGYGVSWDGTITGGFGCVIMDVAGDSEIAGGFGGFIAGYRFLDSPLNLSIVSWTGLGGISTGVLLADGYEGFFGLLQVKFFVVGCGIICPLVYLLRNKIN